jgi:hypothetical protein
MHGGKLFHFRPEGIPLSMDGIHYIVPVHTCDDFRIRVHNYLNCLFYHVRFSKKPTISTIFEAIQVFRKLAELSGETIIYSMAKAGTPAERTAKFLGFSQISQVKDYSYWAIRVDKMASHPTYNMRNRRIKK